MKRLYDVFLSSTQRDLADERQRLTQALLRTRFRPVQMETFPATRHRADQLITDFVLASDFVALILGRSYGSIVPDTDVSFTELEYRNARDAGIPVLVFLEALPEDADLDPRLRRLRDEVQRDLVCQFWTDAAHLVQLVTQSLEWAAEDSPTGGWVRADDLGVDPFATLERVTRPALRLGISQLSIDGVAGPLMGERLGAARSIRILSTTGFRLIETQKRALIRAVEGGCDVRVLVAHEDSEFLRDVAEVEGRDPGADALGSEVHRLRTRLVEIHREVDGSAGSIRLGRMSTQLRTTLTLTDDWGWMSLTLPPLRTPETASFELVPDGEHALLPRLHRHFDAVWDVVDARGAVEVVR